MTAQEIISEKIRELLIEKDGDVQLHELNGIVEEAKILGMDDKQIKKLLPEVDRTINWEHIRQQKEQKAEHEKKLKQEIIRLEEEKKFAPEFLDTLIKFCFADGIVQPKELETIFAKAVEFNEDVNALARKINKKIEHDKFKPYPGADIGAASLKETLCSTTWYDEPNYLRMITPPPPPPPPTPWRLIITAILLFVIVGGGVGYFFVIAPWWRDKCAERYYTYVDGGTLRSSPIQGIDGNKLAKIEYGSELITYEKGTEWYKVKLGDNEGYVAASLIMDSANFYLLNSIFANADSRNAVVTGRCRKALLDYYKRNNYIGQMDDAVQQQVYGSIQFSKEVWQVFSKSDKVKPNAVFYPKISHPGGSSTDFAVVIRNVKTRERKFLLFAFLDNDSTTLLCEQPAPADGDITSVKPIYNKGQLVYQVTYSNGIKTTSIVGSAVARCSKTDKCYYGLLVSQPKKRMVIRGVGKIGIS